MNGSELSAVAFYQAIGWTSVTSPPVAEAGAETLAWEGCPQTFVARGSTLAASAQATEGLHLVVIVEDLGPPAAGCAAAGLTPTHGHAPWGEFLEVVDPAGTRLRYLVRHRAEDGSGD